ncbi:MAG TPA: amidophosphoribosyltransferase, partial [Planctomycetes bacterium]|nr:amidophosphoribosyltransferase [Planctomycetota bacterium]
MPEVKEACGLVGVFGPDDAAYRTYLGLYALQHRGQEAVGIVSSDGESLYGHRELGLLNEVFHGFDFSRLKGWIAAGHVRYSTTGSSANTNTQPLLMEYSRGPVAVAHNGNLVNAKALRAECGEYGSIFQTTSDSEIIVHLLARAAHTMQQDALLHALKRLKGAFSFLIMTPKELTGVRDPFGFRPLALGRLEEAGSYVFASETCAFEHIG